jgi:hypothetical protein
MNQSYFFKGFFLMMVLLMAQLVSCQREVSISKQELVQTFELKLKSDPDVKKQRELENDMLYKTVYTNYYNYDNLYMEVIEKNSERIDNGDAVAVFTEAGMKNAQEYWNNLSEFRKLTLSIKEKYKSYYEFLGEREAYNVVYNVGKSLANNDLDTIPTDLNRMNMLKLKLDSKLKKQ